MNSIKWVKELESGVPIVDVSKQCLLYLSGKMFHPQVICQTPGNSCGRLEDAILFISRNLEKEEALMIAAGYPDLEAHRDDHGALIGELTAMCQELKCSSYDNSAVLNLLAEWVVQHTQNHDKKFGEYWAARQCPSAA